MTSHSMVRLAAHVDLEPFVAAAQRVFVANLDADVWDLEAELDNLLRYGLCSDPTYAERHGEGMGTRGEWR